VDLSAHELVYERGPHLIYRFTVGIGQTRYPTPTGKFFVWAQLPRQSAGGPYGVFALGLNGFSHVFQEFPGPGGAHIAIHGTASASDIGHDVSFGCVRVYNPQMSKLETVPLGTPVTIKP
jgi:lipoprotein-anchoring transpeptidase ErfK/SrfK